MTRAQLILRDQGRTVTWVADRLGKDRSLVSRMLAGRRRMDDATRRQLAQLLGVPAELLSDEAESDEAEVVTA